MRVTGDSREANTGEAVNSCSSNCGSSTGCWASVPSPCSGSSSTRSQVSRRTESTRWVAVIRAPSHLTVGRCGTTSGHCPGSAAAPS